MTMIFDNITFEGVGKMNYPGAHPIIKQVVDAERPFRNPNTLNSLIKVYVYNNDKGVLVPSSFSRMHFREVDIERGALPIIDFDVSFPSKSAVKCTVLIKDLSLQQSEIPSALNESLIPAAALFRVSSQKPLNFSFNLS